MKLLIPEPPLQLLPSLAVRIGVNEALVLQQLHYMTIRSEHPWIERTLAEWLQRFPFWSEPTLKRAFATLRHLGLLEVSQPHGTNRRNRYTLRYDALELLSPSDQSDPIDGIKSIPSNGANRSGRRAQIDPLSNRGERTATTEATSSQGDDVAIRAERRTATQQGEADERALGQLGAEVRPFVDPVRRQLLEVASAKDGAITPTAAAVARCLGSERFKHKDFIPAAERFVHYWLHGLGRGKRVRDVVATYRNWLEREPDVVRRTAPRAPSGATASAPAHQADREVAETRRRLEEAMR